MANNATQTTSDKKGVTNTELWTNIEGEKKSGAISTYVDDNGTLTIRLNNVKFAADGGSASNITSNEESMRNSREDARKYLTTVLGLMDDADLEWYKQNVVKKDKHYDDVKKLTSNFKYKVTTVAPSNSKKDRKMCIMAPHTADEFAVYLIEIDKDTDLTFSGYSAIWNQAKAIVNRAKKAEISLDTTLGNSYADALEEKNRIIEQQREEREADKKQMAEMMKMIEEMQKQMAAQKK